MWRVFLLLLLVCKNQMLHLFNLFNKKCPRGNFLELEREQNQLVPSQIFSYQHSHKCYLPLGACNICYRTVKKKCVHVCKLEKKKEYIMSKPLFRHKLHTGGRMLSLVVCLEQDNVWCPFLSNHDTECLFLSELWAHFQEDELAHSSSLHLPTLVKFSSSGPALSAFKWFTQSCAGVIMWSSCVGCGWLQKYNRLFIPPPCAFSPASCRFSSVGCGSGWVNTALRGFRS